MCQKACPCNAINVDKALRKWAIDPFMCVQCSTCVRACPKDCLHMLPSYTPVSTAQFCNVFDVPDPNNPTKPDTPPSTVAWDYSEPDPSGQLKR